MTNFQVSIPVKKSSKQDLIAFYIGWGLMGAGAGTALYHFATSITPGIAFLAKMPHVWATALYNAVVIAFGLFYVYVPFRLALTNEQGRTLIANQDGLGLPPALGGIVAIPWLAWTDIKIVDITNENPTSRKAPA